MAENTENQIKANLFVISNYIILYLFFPIVILINLYLLIAKLFDLPRETVASINDKIENVLVIAIVVYLYLIIS